MHRNLVPTCFYLLLAAMVAPQNATAELGEVPNGYETYTFEREIRLAPGEFYAVTYDDARKEFVETEPDRGYRGLPDRAFAQILRSPVWLREKFIDRIVDLYYDDLDVGDDAAPAFHDVNGDGIRDLVVGNAQGELKCFVGPYFKEDRETFAHIRCSGSIAPCFSDVDGDGDDELLITDSTGTLSIWGGEGWRTRRTDIPDAPFTGTVAGVSIDENGESVLYVADEAGTMWRFHESGTSVCDYHAADKGSVLIAQQHGFFIVGTSDGTILAIPTGEVDPQFIENLNRIEVSGSARPLLEDVTRDGLPDLLIGASDGTISVYENYGTNDNWWFVSYTDETERKFDDDVGYLSSPCIADVNNDGVNDVVCGAQNIQGLKIYYGPDYSETGGFIYEPGFETGTDGAFLPALGDFNMDGRCDHAIGFQDGTIRVYVTGEDYTANLDEALSRGLSVPGFATPCAGDFDGDGICDIVAGAGDGALYFFKGTGTGFQLLADQFSELEVGEYPSPAAYDFNDDGRIDLVVGNRAGEIRVFLSPDWREVEGGLRLPTIGAFASPAFGDLTADGVPELLIGSVDGTLRYFEGRQAAWSELYSWEFHQTLGLGGIREYFDRTHPEATLLRGMIDDDALNSYLDVFEQCGDEYFDEVAFSFANIQTEILRVMSRLDNADLLFENARAIYDFASRVAYANIKEKDDYTTIEYVSEDGTLREMPRDIYYWWVVHPVIEYEIPARVDASYWRHDAEYYGVTGEQWTRKEITAAEYEHTPNAYFWRTFLPNDARYGKNLLDVVQPARNIKEAAYLVADWITYSGSKPDRWNEYGLASNDLQPLVIYEKNYGSCGEQAMLCVAFSRTALIPNAPVGCHGEDHAWNEWWMDGQWYQWDLSHSVGDLGHPWNEGVGHTGTPLLSITRRRGDGLDENSTTRPINPPGSNYNPRNAPGYSQVGEVTIRVVDELNDPIEGALVVIRSKWNSYYRTSIWDYTDPEGYCFFELGFPITGSCLADVITPLGVTGTEYLIVRENERLEYTYVLPGRINSRQPDFAASPPRDISLENVQVSVTSIEEEQRPRNFSSGRRSEIRMPDLYERTRYNGTRWYSEPNGAMYGVWSAMLSSAQYRSFLTTHDLPRTDWTKNHEYSKPFAPQGGHVILFYNANRYTHVRFNTTLTATLPSQEPNIRLDTASISAHAGERIALEGQASDNLHIAALNVSFNGGADFTDITDAYDRTTGSFAYTWDTGGGGPMWPGVYSIVFRATDVAGTFSETSPIDFRLEPSSEFKDQVVYQDNPTSPLPVSSWMLGPFTVGENERFLGVECRSTDADLDVDLFLFQDKNGNRALDGDNERIASSTSPTAVENIIYNEPGIGPYWIFCQGWHVNPRDDVDLWQDIRDLSPARLYALEPMNAGRMTTYGLIDIALSFRFDPAFIVDISPTRDLLITDPQINGGFSEGINIDESSFKVMFAGADISDNATIDDSGFTISLRDVTLQLEAEYVCEIEATTTTGLQDRVELTLVATLPEVVRIEHFITEDGERLSVSVEPTDEGAILVMARAKIDESRWIDLDVREDTRSAFREISLAEIETGEHRLLVEYLLEAGVRETREMTFEFSRSPQEQLISLIPGDGANVYDYRSVLIAYFSPEIKSDVESVQVFVDGEEVTDVALIYTDGVFYLPTETYTKGEHTFEVLATLCDGRVIDVKATFSILSMDEEETGSGQ